MRLLTSLMLRHKVRLLAAALLTVLGSLVALLPALFLQRLIDEGFSAADFGRITLWAGCIAAAAVAQSVLNVVSTRQFALVGQTVAAEYRDAVVDRLLSLPVNFLSDKGSGYVASRVGEAGQVSSLFLPSNFSWLGTLLQAAFAIAILASMDIVVLSLACVPCLLLGLFVAWATAAFRKAVNASLEAGADWSGKLNETVRGREEIRLGGGRAQEREGMLARGERLKEAGIRQSTLSGTTTEFMRVFATAMQVLVYVLCGWRLVQGSLTLGQTIAFAQYVGKVYAPIIGAMSLAFTVQPALEGMRRIDETFFGGEAAPGQGAAVLGKVGRIEVSGLSFSYPGSGRRLFGDLSFCADNPSLVILRGNNGSGKTTLVKILLRLLGGYDGTIRVDGIDLKDMDEASWLARCACVSQRPFVFNDTIRNNVTYGLGQVSEEDYSRALEQSGVAGLVARLPDGDSTVVGEDGYALSGGERQKLSLARALVRRADVLVLDEPTTGLDADAVRELERLVEELSKGRIVFIIDHTEAFAHGDAQVLSIDGST